MPRPPSALNSDRFNAGFVSNLNAASGTPQPGFTVSIGATLEYNGRPIPINSNSFENWEKNGVTFSLTNSVNVGSINEFLEWAAGKFNLTTLKQEYNEITAAVYQEGGILYQLFDDFTQGEIIITTFDIDTNSETFKLGVTFSLTSLSPNNELFAGLSLDSIGILISYSGK